MERSKIFVGFTFSAILLLPFCSFARPEPVPGKWERKISTFVFDDATKSYVPFELQSRANDSVTECLSEAYFQEQSFRVPKFFAQESDLQGRLCVVSNEEQSGSTTTWRQVCTDPSGSTEDERWMISISNSEVALERTSVTKKHQASSAVLQARNKQMMTLKRIGECDEAPKTHSLSKAQPTQREQDASDRRYEARDGGVVRDVKTGLDWAQSDNGSNISWSDATRYCAAKGSGWRLGSPTELEGIFDTLQSTPCGTQTCNVSSKFTLTDSWFWSNELKHSSYPWTVYLHVGGRFAHHEGLAYYTRALCVRTL
jgi:hypothetical protein